jgi:hypothetical protein
MEICYLYPRSKSTIVFSSSQTSFQANDDNDRPSNTPQQSQTLKQVSTKPFSCLEQLGLTVSFSLVGLLQSLLPTPIKLLFAGAEFMALRQPSYLEKRKASMRQFLTWCRINPDSPFGRYLIDPYDWAIKLLVRLYKQLKNVVDTNNLLKTP